MHTGVISKTQHAQINGIKHNNSATIANALGVMLFTSGWSIKNSLVVLLVQLSVVNTLKLSDNVNCTL